MGRKLRIYYPGAYYHVMLRGNFGEQIFYTEDDRKYLYSLLSEGVERYNYQVHAFCLMTNHIHLVIEVGSTPLSKIIQNIASRYAKRINFHLNRRGHLFQGRHLALLIDVDSYLLSVVRYIHLNPVEAAMIGNPDFYPWSSHRAYLGLARIPWLTTDFVLRYFSSEKSRAIYLYKDFIHQAQLMSKHPCLTPATVSDTSDSNDSVKFL